MDIYATDNPVVFGVPYDDVQSGDLSTVLPALQGFLENRDTVIRGKGRVSLMFEGYDDDPREVFDIPEIRRFAKALDEQFPHWFYFVSLYEGSTLHVLSLCLCRVVQVPDGWMPHSDDFNQFVFSHLVALNQLCERFALDDAIKNQVTTEVLAHLTPGGTVAVATGRKPTSERAYRSRHLIPEHDKDEEEGAESRPDVFGFFPIDRHIQTRLLDACRAMLKRATPAQVHDLAYLIYALQRLPSTTPGVRGGVTFPLRPIQQGESAVSRGFELNAEEFILTTVESVDLGSGPDFGSRNVLEVGTSAMRDIEYGDDFTEWLNLFSEQAEDEATEIEIFCDVADSVNLSENTEGIPWEENPLLDEL